MKITEYKLLEVEISKDKLTSNDEYFLSIYTDDDAPNLISMKEFSPWLLVVCGCSAIINDAFEKAYQCKANYIRFNIVKTEK